MLSSLLCGPPRLCGLFVKIEPTFWNPGRDWQRVLAPQHFIETEGVGTRKTASLVASPRHAKSLSFIVVYLNAEIAEAQRAAERVS